MKKIIHIILLLVLIGFISYLIIKDKREENKKELQNISEIEYVSYINPNHNIEFVYPKSWGDVSIQEGNSVCPEEDTYRTSDTLNVYDLEFSFTEINLPETDSFIRVGIRQYELDPEKLNNCGDDFLSKLANKEIDPRIISSVLLEPIINKNGLSGIYTSEASRLNTEARKQHTFFIKKDSKNLIIQSYMSFIPYYNSPELKEIEMQFNGNMQTYLEKGLSAENIRQKFQEFKIVSESLKFSGK
jgi:hypothetical protein